MPDYQINSTAANIDKAVANANLMLLTGATNPTTSTVGTLGQIYKNTTTGDLFLCTAVSATYTWAPLVVNDLTTGGTKSALSAEQGKELKSLVDAKLPSASYTAADVLAKVKTVDGTGSGLDADLLDGKHASDFVLTAAIVNDLTTGGVDKALSAEQGKVLGQSISQFTAQTIGNVNMLNTADADYKNGYYCHPTTGTVNANASYWCSGFIAVSQGDRIIVTRLPASNIREITNFRYVTAFDTNKAVIAASSASVAASEYIVPAGVSYIRVTGYVTSSYPMIENIKTIGMSLEFVAYGATNATTVGKYTIDAFLPSEICIAVGRTIEIYNQAICPQAEKYNFIWKSSIGYATNRKVAITGASVGNTFLYLYIVDDANNLLFSAVSVVKVVAASTAIKTICPIGDSITNGKAWLAELINLNNNLSLVGSVAFSVADADSNTRTGAHEGHSGWASDTYMTLATYDSTANPFWDATLNEGAGGFSWSYYVTNTLSETAPDAVQIFLGMNHLAADPDSNAGYIKDMVDAIRADAPTMPIYIAVPHYKAFDKYPSLASGLDNYRENLKIFRLSKKLYELFALYTAVYMIPIAQTFDSQYNFHSTTLEVNPRATATVPFVTDPVHPVLYWQMADTMFSVYSAYLN